MQKHLQEAFFAHAKEAYPKECCGMIVKKDSRKEYVRCINQADKPEDNFIISPEEYASIEDEAEILAICHSHPDGSALPSDHDRVSCNASGLPWYIHSYPEGDLYSLVPKEVGLVGRPFVHNTSWDCYGLIKDYYKQILDISLPENDHNSFWWEEGQNLYQDNAEQAGFVFVRDGTLKKHDVIIMTIRAQVPNHGAIYLGDNRMLHHMFGQLSKEEIYGGYWLERTAFVARWNAFV